MKNVRTLAYLMAITMVSTVGFVSCKDKNAPEEEKAKQTEQTKGEVVKTQFAISLPNQLKAKSPRRMPGDNVQLTPAQFQGMTGITLIPYAKPSAIAAGDKRIGDNIELTEGVAHDALTTAANAKVFTDVNIPLTTASFLFYAKSAATGTEFQTGKLTANNLSDNSKELEDLSFSLVSIHSDANDLYLASAAGGKLLAYLSSVANATDGVKAWSEYTTVENKALYDLYQSFISIHGLSSFEVARIMTDLYQSMMPISSPIATAIKTAISNGAKNISAAGVVTLQDDQLNFPQSYNLPEGSVDIRWDAENKQFIKGLYSNMAATNTYVYPAELWYFVNSTIKTSNSSKQTMYDNVNNWAAILGAHTDGNAVGARTRAVAVQDAIQYAVARLDVQVRLASSAMADNSDVVEGAATDVDCSTSGFPVTAILVGGQRPVIWNFTATTEGTEYTIYDNVMSAVAAGGSMVAEKNATSSYSAVNSTLVLENGTADVQIAVEMLNDKADFYGAGGQLIPKNSKFYVVAQLDASAATETGSHVFKQDFTTTAKLTLQNLKSAYNTIPDLRTPKMELGFSVDLTWQDGHTYEINF